MSALWDAGDVTTDDTGCNPSFNYLIGAGQHGWRDGQTERLGSREIDHELELRRLLHWQVGRPGAFEDPVHVGCGALEVVALVNAVRQEGARVASQVARRMRYST